jgi:predicted DNA-binding transcriptional regulator YafY
MRGDRLLSILLLLQVHRRMTARAMAQRLEVSERTIYRDMEALSGAGVPVVAERGVHGGWALLEGYQTNLTGLNEAEVQALFLSTPPRLLADLGLDKAAEAALIKLLAAIPSVSRPGAEEARQRIYVDPSGWRRSEEAIPQLAPVQDAIWRDRRLRMTYARGDDTVVERDVDPLGLVAKGSTWYLVAGVDGAPRTYRVSRIQAVELLDAPCARPPGFDLADYWEQSSTEFTANLPRYPAMVRVHPDALDHLRRAGRYSRVERVHEMETDGWVPVEVMFEDEHSAGELLLGFASMVEVVAPEALRAWVISAAAAIVTLYERSAASGATRPPSSAESRTPVAG